MPPTRFDDFTFERDMLRWAVPFPGALSFEHDLTDSKVFPNVSTFVTPKTAKATFRAKCLVSPGATVTLHSEPTAAVPLRLWWNKVISERHETSIGIEESGQPAFEYAFTHPTFTVNTSTTFDGKSVPTTAKFSAAVSAAADVGASVSYDVLRTGITSYNLGVRVTLDQWRSKCTAYLDSANKLSVVIATRHPNLERLPMASTVIAVEENGASLFIGGSSKTPCGREVSGRVTWASGKGVNAAVSAATPICDGAWRLRLALYPLAVVRGGPWAGATLSAQ